MEITGSSSQPEASDSESSSGSSESESPSGVSPGARKRKSPSESPFIPAASSVNKKHKHRAEPCSGEDEGSEVSSFQSSPFLQPRDHPPTDCSLPSLFFSPDHSSCLCRPPQEMEVCDEKGSGDAESREILSTDPDVKEIERQLKEICESKVRRVLHR